MIKCVNHKWLAWGSCVVIFGIANTPSLDCFGQVVQLPSIHTFSYSGTVSVPDAGIDYLTGVNNSAQGNSTRGWGPYAGRAAGSSMAGGNISLSAMIIDLKAMDDAILGTTAPPTAIKRASATGPNLMNAQPYGYAKKSDPTPDPNSWQRALAGGNSSRPALLDNRAERDIRYFLEKADESMRANRLAAARVFRRMAIERMTPELRERMEQRAREIEALTSGKPANSTLADSSRDAVDSSSPAGAASALNKRQF